MNADFGMRNAELTAEECFHEALDVARLWQSQDKRQEARDLLAPVCGLVHRGV